MSGHIAVSPRVQRAGRLVLNHLRWQLIADRNEWPNDLYNNSSLSFSLELVGTISLDRNDWKIINYLFCLGCASIYLKLRKCGNFGRKKCGGTSFQRRRLNELVALHGYPLFHTPMFLLDQVNSACSYYIVEKHSIRRTNFHALVNTDRAGLNNRLNKRRWMGFNRHDE